MHLVLAQSWYIGLTTYFISIISIAYIHDKTLLLNVNWGTELA